MADPVRPWRRPPPPPPSVSILPPALVVQARDLRRRLGDPAGGGSQTRRQLRNQYDHALVQIADLLQLPNAPEPDLVIGRRVLTTLERSLLEKAAVARGVDLGLAEPSHLRAIGPPPPPRPEPGAWAGEPPGAREAPGHTPGRPERPTPPPLSRRETLAAEARAMHRRIERYESDERLWPTKVQEWCEDLDTYDGILIDLAVEVGLAAAALPHGDRRRLLSEERSSIESGLVRSGVHIGKA